jgi:hypothetical protein
VLAKLFEIRDRGTFIVALAVQLEPTTVIENRLLWKLGFGSDAEQQKTYVMLTRLEGGKSHHDPYDWNDRTFQVAHQHIAEYFDALQTGAVIDVEYLLGETTAPKISELGTVEV